MQNAQVHEPKSTIRVNVESPYRPPAVELFQELWDELGRMYGDVGPCKFRPEQVDHDQGAFVIAWVDGAAAGCGAIRPMEPGVAELKRMYVRPSWRRQGVASAILSMLEAIARERGYEKIRLETGDVQPEAVALYESRGYRPIPPYGQYAGDQRSLCFEKGLIAQEP